MKDIKLIKTAMDTLLLELVIKSDHKILGIWAADCAYRTLHYFEKKVPGDNRPRKALEALHLWIRTGVFRMSDIRGGSLAAHCAARDVIDGNSARSAARSAGQALATAHVKTHSYAASVYAATAIYFATGSMEETNKEREWQYNHLRILSTV